MRLKLWSSTFSAMNVMNTVAGITSTATIEVPQSRRNSTMISDARMMPIRIASRTLWMESVTSPDWS